MNFFKLKTGMADDRFSQGLYWVTGLGLGFTVGVTIFYSLAMGPKQVLLTIVGILGVVFASIHVHLGLAVLVFITYTRFSDTLIEYHGAPSIAKLWIPCLIAIAVSRLVIFGERPCAWKKPMLLMLGFLFACMTSLISARDLGSAQEGMIDLARDLLLAMTVIVLIRTGKAFIFSIWALILAGAFLGTIAVFQYVTNAFDSDFGGFGQTKYEHLAGEVNTNRIGGSIGDPNLFAQTMLVLLPLALNRMLHDRYLSLRWLAGWSLASCTLTVFFTFSRGALIAMFGMIALVMRRRWSPMAILMLVLLVVTVTFFLPDQYFDRLLSIPEAILSSQNSPSEDSLRGRLSELGSAVLMFIDHPLLGVGLNNYPTNYQDYAQKFGIESRHTLRNAHNMYLQWAAETGIVGVGFFGAILWFAFKSLRIGRKILADRDEHNLAGMVAALEFGIIGYLIAGIFLHMAFPRYFWLLMAIAFGVSNFTSAMPMHSTNLARSPDGHEDP
jgi:putative inorganic carbon (hco3(-)) transporter